MDCKIEKVSLADNLPAITRLAFGSLTVSPLQAGKDTEASAEVISYAFSRGINFIDTAQYYNNYHIIRRAFEKFGSTDGVVLSTKTYAYDREGAKRAVDEALSKTGLERIGIFMLHEQESYETLRGHMEALEYLFECKSLGIIKAVGASMHHISAVRGVTTLAKRGVKLDVIHPIFNKAGIGIADGAKYASPVDEMKKALLEVRSHGVGVFGMKALAGGHLCSSAAEAFDFVLDSGCVDSIAVGMQSCAEVDANIDYFVNRKFTEDEKAALNAKVRRLHVEDYCEGCGACVKRCPVGAMRLEALDETGAAKGEFCHTYTHRAAVDTEKCVLCGYCSGVCPAFAVKVY